MVEASAVDSTPSIKRPVERLQISPVDLLKVVSGAAVLASLLMHLVGTAASDAYLREWGVEVGLFPKAVDRVVIAGFGWLLVSGLTLWQVVLDNAIELSLLSAAVVLYWAVLTGLSKRIDRADLPKWMLRLPSWLSRTLAMYVLVLCGLVMVVAAVFLASLVLAQPIVVADRLGKEHARNERTKFARGCQTTVQPRCFELRRGTEVVGRGFLIDSSEDHIAIFDVSLLGVRVIPRQGLEVVTHSP